MQALLDHLATTACPDRNLLRSSLATKTPPRACPLGSPNSGCVLLSVYELLEGTSRGDFGGGLKKEKLLTRGDIAPLGSQKSPVGMKIDRSGRGCPSGMLAFDLLCRITEASSLPIVISASIQEVLASPLACPVRMIGKRMEDACSVRRCEAAAAAENTQMRARTHTQMTGQQSEWSVVYARMRGRDWLTQKGQSDVDNAV